MYLSSYKKNDSEYNLRTLYERLIKKALDKSDKLTNEQIAAMLGISARTLYRIKKELEIL